MRFKPSSRHGAILLLLAAAILAGCGKTGRPAAPAGGGPLPKLAPVVTAGAVSVTTRNTSRVGGTDAIVDAAAVARVAYPGLTPETRPQAVVIVNSRDWAAALASSSLAGAPLHAPILFAEGNSLPEATLQALEAMHPTGAPSLGGAQVITVGTSAALPTRYTQRAIPAADAGSTAAAIERLLAQVARATPPHVIVLSLEGDRALQMPAAGLAAESGAPILPSTGARLPPGTASALAAMHHPSIYVMSASALSRSVLGELARLGRVTRIPETSPGEPATATGSSIAVSRFTDGAFGWGVKEPGHGLVFARSSRPLDAPAAALLSATGQYGPLLLLESPDGLPAPLSGYLGDIQPAYASTPEFQPVRGVYNHGWLIGDERAISLLTQAELDSLLEISPRRQGASEEATVLRSE